VEQNGRKIQQIEASFDNFGMADRNVDSTMQLLSIPGLSPMCRRAGAQNPANVITRYKKLASCSV
jgi:hypothetical protein